MASEILNSLNSAFNDLFQALNAFNVGNVEIPVLKVDEDYTESEKKEENLNNLLDPSKSEKVDEVSNIETKTVLDTESEINENSHNNETKIVVEATSEKNSPVINIKPNETNTKVDIKSNGDDKITCPIHIKPAVKRTVKVNVTGHPDTCTCEDDAINSIRSLLIGAGINFTNIRRVNPILVEVDLILANSNTCTISIDINGDLYSIPVFFISGGIKPGTENNIKSYILSTNAILSVVNCQLPDKNFYVPKNYLSLYTILDVRSLKESDKKKRKVVIERAAKAIANFTDEIMETREPFRFSFARYKSKDEFSLVSSNRNMVSNLSSDITLNTAKEIWINVKDKEGTLTIKKIK